jgi:hypothetical protein
MTVHDRPRREPSAGHAYTLPVVREVPVPGSLSATLDPHESEQTQVYAADSHGW